MLQSGSTHGRTVARLHSDVRRLNVREFFPVGTFGVLWKTPRSLCSCEMREQAALTMLGLRTNAAAAAVTGCAETSGLLSCGSL